MACRPAGVPAFPRLMSHEEDARQHHRAIWLTDMLGGEPRLRQLPLSEQHPQPPRVLAIGLGAPLATRTRLHRFTQMRNRTAGRECVTAEQPARSGGAIGGPVREERVKASSMAALVNVVNRPLRWCWSQ